MTYSTTMNFDAPTGILSGVLTGAPSVPPTIASAEPVSDVVMSGYADGSVSYFGQVRTKGDGLWALATASLPAGAHTIVLTANYQQTAGTKSITTAGAGALSVVGSTRCDQQTISAPRT